MSLSALLLKDSLAEMFGATCFKWVKFGFKYALNSDLEMIKPIESDFTDSFIDMKFNSNFDPYECPSAFDF